MSDTDLEDFLILRTFEEPIPEDTFRAGAEEAMDVLQDLTEEGVGIRWKKSHVRTEADGAVVGTMCHYLAEDEAVVHEHADRAGLPVTRIDRHGKTLENAQ
ncbi:nickel-binding protein [Natronococcus wangiae]|uniref:nickel-binding protein n=1 Tax=Natronococcus wangiae TaxID=3068275 RepID=UPI00273D6756|nr:nickel-binding protein [Natronococcus sp. AD5]